MQSLRGLSADAVNSRVRKAIQALQGQISYIFGSFGAGNGSGGVGEDTAQSGTLFLSEALVRMEEVMRDQGLDEGWTKGLFNAWVGYAPELVAEPDPTAEIEKNIDVAGFGELGRIMKLFYGYMLLEQKGMREFNLPGYDKLLWEDTGGLMKPPTIREIVDMGLNIASVVIPGLGAFGPILALADDALFSLLEMDRLDADHAGHFLVADVHCLRKENAVVNPAHLGESQLAVVLDVSDHQADLVHVGGDHHFEWGTARAVLAGLR